MSAPSLRVLYIDDDAGLCRMVQRHLERNGLTVETVLSGFVRSMLPRPPSTRSARSTTGPECICARPVDAAAAVQAL